MNALERHPMYTPSDLAYLRGHGYDDAEITAFWDRDRRQGKEPLHHQPIPDVIGRLLAEGRPIDPIGTKPELPTRGPDKGPLVFLGHVASRAWPAPTRPTEIVS
jgi:hypothetical protein